MHKEWRRRRSKRGREVKEMADLKNEVLGGYLEGQDCETHQPPGHLLLG